ncbi:TIR domain-containing protein [Clostridium bovifaecis]|uniref:TIR domain-containing protein n=1 Tax=Clostridium bovifaecis TaxID=2184719 RepID=A0A6I6F4I8_9CLOT|nr:TIR domain-containing protein [Clostridium bovifaecis]
MSVSNIMSNIKTINNEIAGLRKKLSDNHKKKSDKYSEIERIKRGITKNTSPSMLKSKQQQIDKCINKIQECEKNEADLLKKINSKEAQLSKKQAELQKEQKKEQDKVIKMYETNFKQQQDSTERLEEQLREVKNNIIDNDDATEQKQYDFFISHASEDKDEVARPLYEALTVLGAKVWYDEFSMKIGDSLRRSIDKGLANSRYGVVIFSDIFFKKPWTNHELDGLVQRQMVDEKVILPIWHKVSKSEVMKYSPSLADILALDTMRYTIDDIAKELINIVS